MPSAFDFLRVLEIGLPIIERLVNRPPAGGGGGGTDRTTARRLDSLEDAVDSLNVRVTRIERALRITPGLGSARPDPLEDDDRPRLRDLGRGRPGAAQAAADSAAQPALPTTGAELFAFKVQLETGINILADRYQARMGAIESMPAAAKQRYDLSPSGMDEQAKLAEVQKALQKWGVKTK